METPAFVDPDAQYSTQDVPTTEQVQAAIAMLDANIRVLGGTDIDPGSIDDPTYLDLVTLVVPDGSGSRTDAPLVIDGDVWRESAQPEYDPNFVNEVELPDEPACPTCD